MKMADKIKVAQEYIKIAHAPGEFVSPTELGFLFGGHSSIGSPIFKKMVDLGIAERNKKGHYRLIGTTN